METALEKLIDSVLSLDLGISKEQFAKVLSYYNFLLDYTKKVNLISNATNEESFIRHIYDVLISKKHFSDCHNLVDIGSGGGIPGVLLAIMNEQCEVTLVESKKKKVDFLETLPALLDLSKIKIEHKNALELKGIYEVITARGFGSVKKIISVSKHFCHKKTEYRLFKGRKQTVLEELEEVKHLVENVEIISIIDPLKLLGERQMLRFSLK